REDEESERDVMAEAVLAREQIEKLPLDDRFTGLAARDTVLARFAEDLLVRDRPGHARDWNREDKEHCDLHAETHVASLLYFGVRSVGDVAAGAVASPDGTAAGRVAERAPGPAKNSTSTAYECPSNCRSASVSVPVPGLLPAVY